MSNLLFFDSDTPFPCGGVVHLYPNPITTQKTVVRVLAIETSCDGTAVAVVQNQRVLAVQG